MLGRNLFILLLDVIDDLDAVAGGNLIAMGTWGVHPQEDQRFSLGNNHTFQK